MISIRQLPLALFALAAFAAPVSGQETQVFPLPQGAYPHDVAPAPDGTVWYSAQRNGRPRHPRPGHRPEPGGQARAEIGAARGHPGPGRGCLAHRQRPERDRARGPERPRGEGLEAAAGYRLRQPEHRRLRQGRNPLVHGPERLLWSARSKDRRDQGLEGSARPGPIRHHGNSRGRRLLRLARRQPHRPDRQDDRRSDRDRAADAGPGRPPGVVGLEGPHLGARSGMPVSSGSTIRRRTPGANGNCPATGPRPTRSTSTSATSSGSRTGARTRSSPSIPRRRQFKSYPKSEADANVRQILGRPGEVWLPESGAREAHGDPHGAPLAVSFRHPALHLGLIFAISASAARAEDAAERGEKLFQYCFACHSVQPDETNLQGPNLRGIVGRPIAAQEGFTYSPAMRALAEREGHWSEALLDRYLAAPYEMVPKTSMAFPGLDEADARSDLIAYLRSTGGPAPVRGSASQAR